MPLWLLIAGCCAAAALARPELGVLERAPSLVLPLAIASFLFLGVLPRTGMYRTVTVLSGSMRPAFAPGDVVVVTPKAARDVRVGDVITYAIPVGDRHVETHRVVEVLRGGEAPVVRTKGDANDAADPWVAQLEGGVVWQQRLTVPGLGWPIVLARTPFVRVLSLFLLPALLVAAGLARIWCRPRAGHAATPTHAAPA